MNNADRRFPARFREIIAKELADGTTELGIAARSALGIALRANSPAVAVHTALAHGRSTTIQLLSDSTGTDTDEWFGLLGSAIAADHPEYTYLWRPWNVTNQNYDTPERLQLGTDGERYATLSAARLQFSATSITGDLDVRVKCAANDWTSGAAQTIAARWETTSNQRGWVFQVDADGKLSLLYSTDGTAVVTATSTTVAPLTDGEAAWVRCTIDVDNGASGRTVTFYTSTDGTTWTQLGAPVVVATAITIFNSTAAYTVGSYTSSNTSPFYGKLYWVQIRAGIDGYGIVPPLVEDWDQTTTMADSVVVHGAPVLIFMAGAASGQNISYLDDSTRRAKILPKSGQDLIFLSSGHNEAQSTNVAWVTIYSAWVANVKTNIPNVPIVAVSQNPTTVPLADNQVQVRSGRMIALAAYCAATAGVYFLDTYAAFSNLAVEVEPSDGLHPTQGNGQTDSGSDVWAEYVFEALAF